MNSIVRSLAFAGVALIVCLSPLASQAELSPLAPDPDWSALDAFQETMTREEFVHWINTLFCPDGSFWKFTVINGNEVTLFGDTEHTRLLYRLRLAPDLDSQLPLRATTVSGWKLSKAGTSSAKPLRGLVICLDPGHIGGRWAKMEERFFQIGSDPPVIEANLNMLAARHAAKLLETAGATVVWTKRFFEPVTTIRPAGLREEALASLYPSGGPAALPASFSPELEQRVVREEERLFYRNAEIRARAELVAKLNPDLTLCIHFNADKWSSHPTRTELIPQSRLVAFVHGNYSEEELRCDDQKWDLLYKLLSRTSIPEAEAAESIAKQMEATWNFPPESYSNWAAARRVGPSPYVFARNLLANRIYHGPVVFVEGPYMNAQDSYDRIIAGDYEGTRIIGGRAYRSLFAEFGEILARGVTAWAGGSTSTVVNH
ncbi:N-acetylmuramoyl-L-alanine amidase [Methylacidimicrobium sp. B4]|uniref:N-acetylmuramoyl-L-alanine amidase n=1 Tax=Methylacidimicrobium sp. B4 TaxID=2796139 RepID=UPI001A8C93E4|nr:N-acetylmuramoyl-L-alanine amidase [Methylacidimicrobium sp. B4]QSR84006.1 N-acetylmuramoyl-L-alanine amidase [Methylacidimicrobium sp. B4]